MGTITLEEVNAKLSDKDECIRSMEEAARHIAKQRDAYRTALEDLLATVGDFPQVGAVLKEMESARKILAST